MSSREQERPDLRGLSPWAPELARTFVSMASDIALVLDGAGVILDVAQKTSEAAVSPSASRWVGQQWIDTVTAETRSKVSKLLQEVADTGAARRREVGHPLQEGQVVPVAYTAVRLGENGPVLAVGRDLRTIAAIQQRFVETQQDLERDYWRARQAEARYRLLFQVATDAVMVVDADTLEIIEANQAATQLFAGVGGPLAGKPVASGFDHYSRGAVTELMHKARGSGDSAEIRARLLGTTLGSSVAATPFRSEDSQRLLVRVRGPEPRAESFDVSANLARLVDDIQEGVVVTDSSGRVLMANPAFLRLIRVDDETLTRGRILSDWIAATSSPMAALVAAVRRDGIGRGSGFEIHVPAGESQAVDVYAVLLTDDDQERIGFTIRPSSAQGAAVPASFATSDSAPGNLVIDIGIVASQLGVLPMNVLMAEASVIIERQLVTLALARTGGDASAAALLLGISRERIGAYTRQAGTS